MPQAFGTERAPRRRGCATGPGAMAAKAKAGPASHGRLDAWARGAIWGMSMAGAAREQICTAVTKSDGTAPSLRAVDGVLARKRAEPSWRGEETHSGRPPALSPTDQEAVVKLVFAERGRAKVTVNYCKKRLPWLRGVSRQTVERALEAAGLRWLRRRGKRLVPRPAKVARVAYALSLKRRWQSTIDRFAYTDGTTFYLARSPDEAQDKKRLALGKHVWRMASGKDGLWDENVGPSLHAKAQGLPVKIWGFFGHGPLHYYVLPKDGRRTTNMNGQRYYDLVSQRFAAWREACFGDTGPVHLVQDHEQCLWQPRNLDALREAGCIVEMDCPKNSPDLNAIEGWWRVLRERLEQTEPQDFEDRDAFLVWLRRTAKWLNEHRSEDGLALCTNQKQRADDVIDFDGGETKW